MHNKVMRIAVFLLAVGMAIPLGSAEGKKVTLTGHLVDQMCGGGIKDVSKAKEHTKECALMKECVQSGFGIFTNGKFVKFDTEGSNKAKALVEKSSKEKDLQVVVEGTEDGDVLTLSSIEEK